MARAKVKLRYTFDTNKAPEPDIMEFGEIYINANSGIGNSFLSVKKENNTIAQFMEKDYADSQYADKSLVNAINSNYISGAVMSTTAVVPSVSNNILTIPTIDSSEIDNKISTSISQLDGNATIASKNGKTVTLKASVSETDGIISNGTQTDIVLSDVASTGEASDVSATYQDATEDVQSVITSIDHRVKTLETNSTLNTIVCAANASEIPAGAVYNDGTTTITGTLAASQTTMGDIYLVKNTNTYYEYITTRTGQEGSYNYSWINLGSTSVDLSGYINSIIINGKTYTATGNGNSVTLDDVLTNVVGETEVANGNADFVSVTATNGTASSGSKSSTLLSKVKIQSVSGATSTNNGLASSNDIREYVQANLTTIKTWTESDITN